MDIETLFDFVKTSLRIAHDDLDDEIKALIDAGIDDVSKSCELPFNFDDINECKAVALFVKGYLGTGDDECIRRYNDRMKVLGVRKCNSMN